MAVHCGTTADIRGQGTGVDDAPYTEDLDPASVSSGEELFVLLRTVHLRADKPSLRALEARTRHSAVPLSKTVVSEMLNGARFPRKAVMLAFLRACGVPDDQLTPWTRAWERITTERRPRADALVDNAKVPSSGGSGVRGNSLGRAVARVPVPDRSAMDPVATMGVEGVQLSRLRAENERLRMQLASSGSLTAGQRVSSESQSVARAGPTVRRRELGVLLRALRTRAGLTAEQVAEHLLCSPQGNSDGIGFPLRDRP
jgi:hypothetical protein